MNQLIAMKEIDKTNGMNGIKKQHFTVEPAKTIDTVFNWGCLVLASSLLGLQKILRAKAQQDLCANCVNDDHFAEHSILNNHSD